MERRDGLFDIHGIALPELDSQVGIDEELEVLPEALEPCHYRALEGYHEATYFCSSLLT